MAHLTKAELVKLVLLHAIVSSKSGDSDLQDAQELAKSLLGKEILDD